MFTLQGHRWEGARPDPDGGDDGEERPAEARDVCTRGGEVYEEEEECSARGGEVMEGGDD